MALSKKMKEILAGFWALMRRYETARECGDREAALKFGEDLLEYCTKYRRNLNFSEEYIADWRKNVVKYKDSLGKEKIAEAELADAIRAREKSEREYLKAIAEADKNNLIKWN